jgi:hypothetical protein
MALPFTSISERHQPDDVLSADHMQLLVDKINDADDLLINEHGPGDGVRAGDHLGYAPPVHIGSLIVRPPIGSLGQDETTVVMLAGYIDPDSVHWEDVPGSDLQFPNGGAPDPSVSGDPNATYMYFSFATPGSRMLISAIEIQSSFTGSPSTNADGAGHSNLTLIRPCTQVVPLENGTTKAEAYFGPGYVSANFKTSLAQFTVLVYGYPRTR